MTPLDRWDTTAYKSSIVTMAIFCTVFEIPNFLKNTATLKYRSGVIQGH